MADRKSVLLHQVGTPCKGCGGDSRTCKEVDSRVAGEGNRRVTLVALGPHTGGENPLAKLTRGFPYPNLDGAMDIFTLACAI